MFRDYFILLLLAHIIGDFYFKTSKMEDKKHSSIKWALLNGFFYLLITMVILIPIISKEVIILGLTVSILHSIIDIVEYSYVKKIIGKNKIKIVLDRNLFFVDQAIHILILIIISYLSVMYKVQLCVNGIFIRFFEIVGVGKFTFLCWAVALLIIYKPANIAIQKLLMAYKPENKDIDVKTDNNAGRFIGTIERIIMLIFLAIGQYSAIGLVLTAKSIARYDRISKEKDFAEYYLLGTLISTMTVIVVSFIV